MIKILTTIIAWGLLFNSAAWAQTPRVATDIAPLYALVARVMQGVGAPDLIIRRDASPHNYSLRPSGAAALEQADIVFWVSRELTPWLENSITTLAPNAVVMEFMKDKRVIKLSYRKDAAFKKRDARDDKHDKKEDRHHHKAINPHAWLDPQNGKIWLTIIADKLSQIDPDNANVYSQNAAAGKKEIDDAIVKITTILKSTHKANYIVFHDAYQYFENRFNFFASGAITIGDASQPSPARIAQIKEKIAALKITCVLAEPQFNQGLIKTVIEGSDIKIATVDPLGKNLTLDKKFYANLLSNIAKNIADCH